MRIQQPHDSGKKAWKRARRYRAERSIVCTVFIFIEAITGPLNSIVVRDDYITLHYYYKAAIQDQMSTKVLALQLMVIARSGVPPDSWSVGLQAMLEKIAGVCLVEKLRAIQLYEADFNCFNYFFFGRSAMDSLTKNDFLPEELFSQKGSTAEDA